MLLFNTSDLAVHFTRISSMSLFFHPIVFLLSVYEKNWAVSFRRRLFSRWVCFIIGRWLIVFCHLSQSRDHIKAWRNFYTRPERNFEKSENCDKTLSQLLRIIMPGTKTAERSGFDTMLPIFLNNQLSILKILQFWTLANFQINNC